MKIYDSSINMNMTRTILAAAALLVIGLFSVQETSAQERDVSKIKIPKVESRGGVYYVVLDGKTAYARGYQHGRALKFPITLALRNFTEWLRANAGIKDPEEMIQDFAKSTGYIAAAKQKVPDLIEEMQGISDGAGVDFNELFVYQSFDELFLFLMQSGAMDRADGHCTTTAVYGRSGLPNYITHNNDIPTYHESVGTVLHIKYPDSDLEILQGTFAGQIAQNGVNNRGLGVGINTVADLAKTQVGLPVSFNVRKILECGDRNEAVAYLDGIQAGTAMNYMLCDRNKAVSVETWEDNSKVVDVYEGNYAVHTNHAIHKDAPVEFKMDASSGGGSYGFTHQRLELGLKIMKQKSADMTFEGVREMMSTRPILVYPGKPTGRTHQSMIVEIPKSGSPALYTTPDSPNRFEHVKFTFEGPKGDQQAIGELVKIQDAALAAQDRETLNKLFDDGGHFTTEDGKVLKKNEYISDCLSHSTDSMIFETSDSIDVSVRVIGDTAIQTGTWIGTGKNDGKPFRIEKRSITIWIRSGSSWVNTEEQTFRVPTSD